MQDEEVACWQVESPEPNEHTSECLPSPIHALPTPAISQQQPLNQVNLEE